MDTVQNCDSYVNVLSSQTYRSYFCVYHKVSAYTGDLGCPTT
jgi:hypothetical protein